MNQLGTIAWVDLTVPEASALRDFYAAVTAWTPSEVPMGGYADYCMHPAGDQKPVAGICHARGSNTGLPPQWLIYITVSNLDESIERCCTLGGALLKGPQSLGTYGRYAVIQDPAGAVAALMEASSIATSENNASC